MSRILGDMNSCTDDKYVRKGIQLKKPARSSDLLYYRFLSLFPDGELKRRLIALNWTQEVANYEGFLLDPNNRELKQVEKQSFADKITKPTLEASNSIKRLLTNLVNSNKVQYIELPTITDEIKKNKKSKTDSIRVKDVQMVIKYKSKRHYRSVRKEIIKIAAIMHIETKHLNLCSDSENYDQLYHKAIDRGYGDLIKNIIDALNSISKTISQLLKSNRTVKKYNRIYYHRLNRLLGGSKYQRIIFNKSGIFDTILDPHLRQTRRMIQKTQFLLITILLMIYMLYIYMKVVFMTKKIRDLYYIIIIYIKVIGKRSQSAGQYLGLIALNILRDCCFDTTIHDFPFANRQCDTIYGPIEITTKVCTDYLNDTWHTSKIDYLTNAPLDGKPSIFKGVKHTQITYGPKVKLVVLIEHDGFTTTFTTALQKYDDFKQNIILISSQGVASKQIRQLMNMMKNIPIIQLHDIDPGGYRLTIVNKFGKYDSCFNEVMTIPHAIYLPHAGVCYEAGKLEYNRNCGRFLNDNALKYYKHVNFELIALKHPFGHEIFNRFKIMLDTSRTYSLSNMDPEVIWKGIKDLLEHSESAGIDLTATILDGDKFIEKMKFLAFYEADIFDWHFDIQKKHKHFPMQIFDRLSKTNNETFIIDDEKIDMLPLRLIISSIEIPKHNSQHNDIQIHLTPKANYTIITYVSKECVSHSAIELDDDKKDEIIAIVNLRYDTNTCDFITVESGITWNIDETQFKHFDVDSVTADLMNKITIFTGMWCYLFIIEILFAWQNHSHIPNEYLKNDEETPYKNIMNYIKDTFHQRIIIRYLNSKYNVPDEDDECTLSDTTNYDESSVNDDDSNDEMESEGNSIGEESEDSNEDKEFEGEEEEAEEAENEIVQKKIEKKRETSTII